ncbi:EscC/YscC/HrcC family type III secretion system outer membrane ring protein [Burkholderia sp. WSM2232]|uniref:EscC/YscC/HrcC family type III secretion system outer membrane ring protein n=1 Tax=Burkholderia sp. WSM2232 TaxID=944436 RepID=UPI00041D135E|nr:EscC/YscC/HrcC family type III secretion system outer membrane ring protein [Burkholderia sp. WSM2232]
MNLSKTCLLLAAASILSAAWGTADAAIALQGADFFVATRGTKVAALLKDFGANYGVPVIVSREVNDTFVGTLKGLGAQAVLDRLSSLYNLAWYFDGRALYVYKAQEVTSEVLAPSYLGTSELSNYLREARVLDGQYCSVRPAGKFNALEVFGVPACVTRVKQLARNLDQQMLDQAQNQETVQVFPLRYAAASDGSYTYRNQSVVIPGVVTELREMSQSRSLPVTAENGKVVTGQSATGLPLFSADSRRNAVIVRDRKANMPLYTGLIAQLDQRPQQIQISVAIIDVDAGDLKTLGVDLQGSMRVGPGRVSLNSGGASGNDGMFSSLLSNAGDFLLRVNALEQTSRAKVLSRPSIVTLNNVQAVLDRNVTFYTKLEGDRVAQLASVAAGSLLRVTPRVIKEGAQDEVMLTLDLQDGRQGNPVSAAEPLPQVQNSGIATQAILKTGQSLLLGGFVQDNENEGVRKIPLLGDIPVLGKLFSTRTTDKRSVVRLFLIKAEPQGPIEE